MRRPPLGVLFVALLVIALGETAGAAMSRLRPSIESYARARVAANPAAHGLTGSAEYDAEVTRRAVYTAEAGLSFFHTHAQGLGPLVLLVSDRRGQRGAVAPGARRALRPDRGGRALPLGYLVYSVGGARARTRCRGRARRELRARAARQRGHRRVAGPGRCDRRRAMAASWMRAADGEAWRRPPVTRPARRRAR